MRILILIFVALTPILVKPASALEVKCAFYEDDWAIIGKVYTCSVKELEVLTPDEVVTKIIGTHETGRNNNDVKKLNIQQQRCEFLPTGFEQFFPNLEGLRVAESGLASLSQSDLSVYPKLRSCDMFHNYLKVLDADLFAKNPEIEYLYFGDNALKFIGHDILQPLKKLEKATFQGNSCLNKNADAHEAMQKLQEALNEECGPSPDQMYKELRIKYEKVLEEIKERDRIIEQLPNNCESKTSYVTWIFVLLMILAAVVSAFYFLKHMPVIRGKNTSFNESTAQFNELSNELASDIVFSNGSCRI